MTLLPDMVFCSYILNFRILIRSLAPLAGAAQGKMKKGRSESFLYGSSMKDHRCAKLVNLSPGYEDYKFWQSK